MSRHAQPTALARWVLALMPGDGTPLLNGVIRATRERRVDKDRYFNAYDERPVAARIARLRGQGRRIFLKGLQEETSAFDAEPAEAEEGSTEAGPREPNQAEILLDPAHRTMAPAIVGGFLESGHPPVSEAKLGDVLREAAS